MQNRITILSKYKFHIQPQRMDKDIEFIAECLFLKTNERGIICDVRVLNPSSLKALLDRTCKYLQRFEPIVYKNTMNKIKSMYKNWERDFVRKFRPQDLYKDLGKQMWKHQMKELMLSCYHRSRMLAFEMGTGKTLTAASISKIHNLKRTVVVCPNIVKWNWYKDLTGPDGWGFDELTFTILDANKSITAMLEERFVIMNYEMLKKEDVYNYVNGSSVDHIIIDESHYVKSEKSQRHKAVLKLVKDNPRSKVTLLSGTPVSNRVVDLFGQCRVAQHGLGRNKNKFVKLYAKGKRGKVTGVKNVDDLRLKMSNFWNIKKSAECQDLPELRIKKYYLDGSNFKGEYNELMDELHNKDREYRQISLKIKALEGRVMKDDPELKELKRERFKVKGSMKNNINTINRVTSIAKLPSVFELVDSMIEQGEKVVIFGSYKDPLKAVTERYKGRSVYIAGDVPVHKREQRIEEFKKDPTTDVFVGQVVAAGIGINLVNSTKCLFLNFPFTPDLLEQPWKRLHRGGQKKSVDVMLTICQGTIDEHLYGMVTSKGNDINEVVNKDKKGKVEYSKIQDKLIGDMLQNRYGESSYHEEQKEDDNGFVKV